MRLLVAIVVGGMGSLTGAVIGGVVLVYLPGWADGISSGLGLSRQISANLSLAIFGGALIVVMLVLPGGIMGTSRRLWALRRTRRAPQRRMEPASQQNGSDE